MNVVVGNAWFTVSSAFSFNLHLLSRCVDPPVDLSCIVDYLALC